MSLKDNLQEVKNELSTEEKFLESSIKAERFFKKYKYPLIAVVVIIIAILVSLQAYDYMKKSKQIEANVAYNKLLKNPQDKEALESLKLNDENLYSLFIFREAINKQNTELLQKIVNEKKPFISSVASYELASKESNLNTLKEYADSGNSLRDLASIETAYLMIKDGKYAEAKNVLDRVPSTSKLSMIAQTYKHFLATKVQQ